MLLLNPIENYGWESIYENSSATKLTNWGMFLGNRYKGSSNIQWFHGNDYQDWPAADTAFSALSMGSRASTATTCTLSNSTISTVKT
jgi:hypothetical protein